MPRSDPADVWPDTIAALLHRPPDQRLREYRYRFAQGLIFGLPVVALQLWGPNLGGPEARRWVLLFQLLLAGWVLYVAAAGMLFEGILLASRGIVKADGIVALLSVGLYLASLAAMPGWIDLEPLFHWSVTLVTAWCGWRWLRMKQQSKKPE